MNFSELREQAWRDFQRRGYPTRKHESWHYTDVKPWFEVKGPPLAGTTLSAPKLEASDFQIWFVDGMVQAERTRLPAGVELMTWSEAMKKDEIFGDSLDEFILQLKNEAERAGFEHGAFVDLNLAWLHDGTVVRVEPEISVREPIHVVMEWKTQSVERSLVHWLQVGRGSRLNWCEWNLAGAGQAHLWTRVSLAPQAQMAFSRVTDVAVQSASVALLTVDQEEASEFLGVSLCKGSGLARETWLVDHAGERALTRLSGMALGEQKDHMDLCSVITHQVGHGISEQRYRAVLAGASRGVFNGRIVIAKNAQQVAANQLSQSLLLSPEAEANAKPELEIYADNVKANHGATMGQLDPEEIFYLRSRGLRKEIAERLVAEGFAKSALEILPLFMQKSLAQWTSQQMGRVIGGSP